MSRGESKRDSLIEALLEQGRITSTQSVLISQAVADRLGINPTDLECLEVLQRSGSVTAGDLAGLTGLTTGAITGLIDRLERGGFVERAKDPDDRRRVIVRPIMERLKEIEPLYAELVRNSYELFKRYSDEQLTLVLDFARRTNVIAKAAIASLRGEATQERGSEGTAFSAPLAGAIKASLLFEAGATQLTIRSRADMPDLFRGHFANPIPAVQTQSGRVSIRYNRMPFKIKRDQPAELILNSRVPWRIAIKFGAEKLMADLSELQLQSLEIHMGAKDSTIILPRPSGTVPVRITWGLENVTIYRPAGTAARLRVHPAGVGIKADGRIIAHMSTDTRWETPDYSSATNRYDIDMAGGAKNLTIATR